MYFDFKLFSAFATKAYKSLDSPIYSLEEALSVFRYYFETYEHYGSSNPHPPIKVEQIARFIEAMPSVECEHNNHTRDIEPEDYETLIDQHFQTPYRNCDYNINHFFTGDIRMNRFYETLY